MENSFKFILIISSFTVWNGKHGYEREAPYDIIHVSPSYYTIPQKVRSCTIINNIYYKVFVYVEYKRNRNELVSVGQC